jgi:cytosine/adenosine deaminase-related metal-dependent hydrolase
MSETLKIVNAFICRPGVSEVTPVFGDLEVADGKIVKITPREFSAEALNRVEDTAAYNAGGRMLTVPLVNFHDHIYSRLAKGLPLSGDFSNFVNVLKNLWWKLDQLLDEGMNNASAEMTALESIRNGVTYIFDHHASPNSTKGSLKTIKQALQKYGLRGVLCFETTSRYGEAKAQEGLEENLHFALHESDADFKGMIGLHASFTVADDVLARTKEAIDAAKTGVHVHVCEDFADRTESERLYGALPVARYVKAGVINERSIFAHCIHLTPEDIAALKEFQPAAVFNADSNLNNAVGLSPYGTLQNVVTTLAGTDGMHANLARSAKQLFLLARHTGMSSDAAFGFFIKLYFQQLSFVKRYFPDYPSLEVGDRADFILWDYVPPTPLNAGNFFGHYIYGALEYPVRSVVQNGKFLMKDHSFTFSGEADVHKEIYVQGARLHKKFAEA